jgi:uncharacterized protein YkwD
MRRLGILVTCAFAALTASASAAPRILSATVQGSPLPGQALTVAVVAVDDQQPLDAVHVSYPGDDGGFGESACRVSPDGQPAGGGPFSPGTRVRFDLPYRPDRAGLHLLKVTVTSGACGGTERSAATSLAVQVGLPELPPVPTIEPPPLARASAASCPGSGVLPGHGSGARVRAATTCLMNLQRAAHGLPMLRTDRRLRTAAARHTSDMVRRRFFDHSGPGGPDFPARLRRVRFWPATAGENLGEGSGGYATPAAMVAAWMNSAPHRANILMPSYRSVGVGVASRTPSGGAGATYTVDFGRR